MVHVLRSGKIFEDRDFGTTIITYSFNCTIYIEKYEVESMRQFLSQFSNLLNVSVESNIEELVLKREYIIKIEEFIKNGFPLNDKRYEFRNNVENFKKAYYRYLELLNKTPLEDTERPIADFIGSYSYNKD
ncbi:hypothetical protein [Clostridium sp.]|uniref:hypothetical protein n=1 Tax=Clostridium sp. TaxID=1506 RepID=UPI00284D0ACB|nr:hypothetical protein [Clostridium sp.]MDR3597101.1 hypothetical protein [Clostridium sp.]